MVVKKPSRNRKDTSKRLGDTISFLSRTPRPHKISWIPVDSDSALAPFNWIIATTGYLHAGRFVCLLISKVLMVLSSPLWWIFLVFSPTGRTVTTRQASVLLVSICWIPALLRTWFATPIRYFKTHSCWQNRSAHTKVSVYFKKVICNWLLSLF